MMNGSIWCGLRRLTETTIKFWIPKVTILNSNTTRCTEKDEAQTNQTGQAQIDESVDLCQENREIETNQVTNANDISKNLFIDLQVFPHEQNTTNTS